MYQILAVANHFNSRNEHFTLYHGEAQGWFIKPSNHWGTINGASSVLFLVEPRDSPLDPEIVTEVGGHEGQGPEVCPSTLRRGCTKLVGSEGGSSTPPFTVSTRRVSCTSPFASQGGPSSSRCVQGDREPTG